MKKVKKISQKLPNGEFSSSYPIGVDSINVDMSNGNNLEEEIKKIKTIFQIIDKNTLFSCHISAYKSNNMKENELKLINSYFSIRKNGNTNNYTLIIN